TIAGDHFKVHTLIDPGQDPHHWMPNPKQMLALNKAKAWWPAGLPFEQKLLPKIKTAANGPQIFPPDIHPTISDNPPIVFLYAS
ncbi:MAG: zinc ABC transporter substrate-binding protein, partial [Bacteroidales bacterium]|nr:zinc ABC transporter substrate-binding protein [Bacteroidales bacterium]